MVTMPPTATYPLAVEQEKAARIWRVMGNVASESDNNTRHVILPADRGRLQRREDLETLHKMLRVLDFPPDMDHADAWCTTRSSVGTCFAGAVPPGQWGIAVVSVKPLESICAQKILSNFLQQVKRFIPDFSGETKARRLDGRNADSFRMSNTALGQLVEVFTNNKFCTIEDAYIAVAPALVEKMPPTADSRAAILDLTRAQQEEGMYKIDDIEFWLSYTTQWTARQCTRYLWGKSLGNYVEATRTYFKTAQLYSAAANIESPSEATQKRFEQANAKLARACNLVAWRAQSYQLSHDFNAAEQLFQDV
ncbi:hypothetical protein BDD12DRAFT_892631 [Trichophaea hybrida]|nr:hypothetical protein BDD12DRAFT_892631 [Trichophaea hybrida]